MLEKLIEEFSVLKPKFDTLKKQVDELNKQIKAEMAGLGMNKHQGEFGTITLTTSNRVKIDSDILLSIIQENEIDALKLVPDEDKVSELIEDGVVEYELIEPAMEVTETVTLRFKPW